MTPTERAERKKPRIGTHLLVNNAIPAAEDCRWCDAHAGEVHGPACPLGERYKQVQQLALSGYVFPFEQDPTPAHTPSQADGGSPGAGMQLPGRASGCRSFPT